MLSLLRGTGSIPGQGTDIPQAARHASQKQKTKNKTPNSKYIYICILVSHLSSMNSSALLKKLSKFDLSPWCDLKIFFSEWTPKKKRVKLPQRVRQSEKCSPNVPVSVRASLLYY